MDLQQKPVRHYQSHRENQRERILEVAERLFIQNGIDRVSISEIAQAARLSRHTVYAYFPNKQEVAWGIFQKLVEESSALFAGQVLPEGTGFQRLEFLVLQFIGQLEAHPEHARFIVEFNTLYAREGNTERIRQVTGQASLAAYDLFPGVVRQGIADGSIRADLDPVRLTAAILNLVNALSSRFALLGELISQEYDLPAPEIYQDIYRTFLCGIQFPAKPE